MIQQADRDRDDIIQEQMDNFEKNFRQTSFAFFFFKGLKLYNLANTYND